MASQNETCLALEIIIVVQATDCRASHCKPTVEQSASITIVLPARRSTPVRLSKAWAVRQITETGLADLGDCETLSLPNELKLIHQPEADVVLVELRAIVRRESVERHAAG